MRSKVLFLSLFDQFATLLISPIGAMLASPAEKRLWREIATRQLGVVFQRQVMIGGMLVDFLAVDRKLIIEVDRAFHPRDRSADARRDARLQRLGYRVLRFPDWLLDRYLDDALKKIREHL